MTGFYDTLESISDDIDWYIDDLSWDYRILGWEHALLRFTPFSKLPTRIAQELYWAKQEVTSCKERIGDKDWPEAEFTAAAAEAAVSVYKEAYNKHKYFWMRSA